MPFSSSKSSTGVDWFIVDTEHGAAVRIHRAVDYWAKHIVDQIKNTTHSRSRPVRDVSGGGEGEGTGMPGGRSGGGAVSGEWIDR